MVGPDWLAAWRQVGREDLPVPMLFSSSKRYSRTAFQEIASYHALSIEGNRDELLDSILEHISRDLAGSM